MIKDKDADLEALLYFHGWEELPNSEEVAQDIHVDLADYFTFELLTFCTFILLYFCTTFGRGDWIEGMEHIFESF